LASGRQFKPSRRLPIGAEMNVSAASGDSPLYPSQADAEVQRTMLVLKKQQEVVKDTAQGLVSLIEAAASPAPASASTGIGRLISAYA